jgi:hypothetical protein
VKVLIHMVLGYALCLLLAYGVYKVRKWAESGTTEFQWRKP